MTPMLETPRLAPISIDTETFYAGVLLALASIGSGEFTADGARFHAAFTSAVEAAREGRGEIEVKDLDWMVEDPVYGVMPHAEEMLAYGQSARLLSLMNPDLVKAKVRYPKDRATAELQRITQHSEWFKNVARAFAHHFEG